MGRRRQKIKLPIEVNNLLQQVKEVSIRGVWRKQLKNDLAIIEMHEKWIEEAYKPLVHKDYASDWMKKSDEEYKERLIELVPERREKKKTMEEQYCSYVEKLKEFIKGDQSNPSKYIYC